jgi:hypothetical protein
MQFTLTFGQTFRTSTHIQSYHHPASFLQFWEYLSLHPSHVDSIICHMPYHHPTLKMILARAVVLISLQFIDLFHVVQSVRSPGQLSTHWRVQRNLLNILDWHEKIQPIQCSLGWARKTLPPASGTTLACKSQCSQVIGRYSNWSLFSLGVIYL